MQMHTDEIVRVVIANDHPLILQGLQTILHQQAGFQVVGIALNEADLVQTVQQQQPDVVLTAIKMPEMDGVEVTRTINKHFPQTGVIALTTLAEERLLLEMLKAGAKGFLYKDAAKEEVVQAVKVVYNKGSYYCNDIRKKITSLLEQKVKDQAQRASNCPDLTEKEKMIIRLICQQLSSKEITEQMKITSRSVESIRERLQSKIGARNMVGIALYAVKYGLYISV